MTIAAVVLAPSGTGRVDAGRARGAVVREVDAKLAGALDASFDEVLAVITDEADATSCPDGVTLLLDESRAADEASLLRVAADWTARSGHDRLVVALPSAPAVSGVTWRAVADAVGGQLVVARNRRGPIGLVRLDSSVFSLLPLEGRVEVLWRSRPELVSDVLVETP